MSLSAQDQGGDPGPPDRAGLHQGPHPRALSERDLSGLRLLRRRRGGAQLFQQVAGRADASPRRPFWPGCPRRPTNYDPRPPSRGRQGAARLGDRPDAGGRLHHGGARPTRPRAEPLVLRQPRRDRRRRAPITSPRRSAASWSAASARPALRGRPVGAHDASIPRCRRSPTARCATGSIAYDRRQRLARPLGPARTSADWPAAGEAALRRPGDPAASSCGDWQRGVVLESSATAGEVGFARRQTGTALARRGRRPGRSGRRRAVARGDVVLVEPVPRTPRQGTPPAPRRCARARRSRARWSRWTRIPAACWR